MLSIKKIPTPTDALLDKYASVAGAYTDCYMTEISRNVSFSEFVFTFYTTPLFKLERLILKWSVSKPSTDMDARQVADGARDNFAAWTVEGRSDNQILLCDFMGRTRSWLMVKPNGTRTRLYFGSAVVPKIAETSLGPGFRALLGFHQVYSVLLLWSAKGRIQHQR